MKQETDRQKQSRISGDISDIRRAGSDHAAGWTTGQIESHLRSAVGGLTPDLFDRLDLSVPQDPVPRVITPIASVQTASRDEVASEEGNKKTILRFERHLRRTAATAAAFLFLLTAGGGALQYHARNVRVDSVIGIDVNPSVELSINQKSRILTAEALNEDAKEILSDMDLKGVDLNVAVNAVIGSMVTHGYLDETENAILVTVNNDSVSKASKLRSSVVGDIETTLREHQVQAVVYDQQAAPEDDEVSELAKEYGISYGKAYFLKELIAQNKNLTMDDMKRFSTMTMEEIAAQINEESLALGEKAEQAKETESETETSQTAQAEETQTGTAQSQESVPEMEVEESKSEQTASPTQPASSAAAETEATTSGAEDEEDVIEDDGVEIDYAEWEDDQIFVYFATFVKWKNPTVLIRDEDGNHYPAYVDDTSKDECVISAEGLEGGKTYTFVLGGLTPREGKHATTVTGTFEKPEIAEDAMDDPDEDEEEEEEISPSSKSDKESGSSQAESSKESEESSGDSGKETADKDSKQETVEEKKIEKN
ncbi:anti-sigma-I factor RsgI family protein [Brotaphodocola sp.]|uniref:anti-sigma-I factor RsgI family protein n=1 Tax=Brotaphodocola sp. TaxID=3073577 RepID=UPI003D7ECC22